MPEFNSRREAIRARNIPGEKPDPIPIHIPGKTDAPLTLREEMRRFVREELSKSAEEVGAETFEESNDFEIEDDQVDLLSAYTVYDLAPEEPGTASDIEGEAPTDPDQQQMPLEPSEELSATKPATAETPKEDIPTHPVPVHIT
jgi:hypothetical protein